MREPLTVQVARSRIAFAHLLLELAVLLSTKAGKIMRESNVVVEAWEGEWEADGLNHLSARARGEG